jgi:hypothetical protein
MLRLITNLNVPHRKSKWTTRERTTIQDGVTMIRPLRNGKPGGTEREVSDSIAEFERACRRDCLIIEPIMPQVDLYAKILEMFDDERRAVSTDSTAGS